MRLLNLCISTREKICLPASLLFLPQSPRYTHDQHVWRHPNIVCICPDIKHLHYREILNSKVLKFGTQYL